MSIKDLIQPTHKAVAVALGHAIFGGDVNSWDRFIGVIVDKLTDAERVALAFSAIKAVNADQLPDTLRAACGDATDNTPIAPLINHLDEAETWANWQEPAALEAYAFVCFTRMSVGRQDDLLRFVRGRAAA